MSAAAPRRMNMLSEKLSAFSNQRSAPPIRFLFCLRLTAIFQGKAAMRIIAIANQKGGVGKTTTAVNLAASLAAAEHRTLLIDLDPQGNATSALGVEHEATPAAYDLLMGGAKVIEVARPTVAPGLDLVPAGDASSGRR